MKELIKKYDDLSNQYDNIAKQKQKVVKDIVELLQEKNKQGFIEFNETTTYPTFYDESIDETEYITKARVAVGRLELTTESNKDLWFNPNIYGELDTDEFMSVIENHFM